MKRFEEKGKEKTKERKETRRKESTVEIREDRKSVV